MAGGGVMFRLEPAMPAVAYRTFQVAAPLSTHFVPATCAETDCAEYLAGWKTIVPGDSPQAAYIRSRDCGRSFTEAAQPGGLVEFTFGPGQRCFRAADHKRRLERPEIFVMRDGDHRGNPLGTDPVKVGPTSWLDTFGEHQEKLAHEFGKG